jgi:hypothetical protein
MTATGLVTIWCDGKRPDGTDCGWHVVGDSAAEIRRDMRGGGWLVGLPGGRDLCPEHVDQRKTETRWGDGLAGGGQ